MKLRITRQRALEHTTSAMTLTGMYLGTNSLTGIIIYLVARLVWWALIVEGKLWGLAVLNVGMTVVWLKHLAEVQGWISW